MSSRWKRRKGGGKSRRKEVAGLSFSLPSSSSPHLVTSIPRQLLFLHARTPHPCPALACLSLFLSLSGPFLSIFPPYRCDMGLVYGPSFLAVSPMLPSDTPPPRCHGTAKITFHVLHRPFHVVRHDACHLFRQDKWEGGKGVRRRRGKEGGMVSATGKSWPETQGPRFGPWSFAMPTTVSFKPTHEHYGTILSIFAVCAGPEAWAKCTLLTRLTPSRATRFPHPLHPWLTSICEFLRIHAVEGCLFVFHAR